jgi:3-hydroxyisobutyrate dehydrogenase-like beta-hydroxyacid dehydrogenase
MSIEGKVAFLGLGLMGEPMAERMLRAGADLAVWNRSPEKAAGLAAAGARVGATAAATVAGAAIVCLCLTDAAAADAVLFGPDALVIDFSTIGVAAAVDFAARLKAASGADWLDAPVSGGVPGARSGRLIVFCGGSEAAVERAKPLLAAVSVKATRLGDAGAGQAAKLCNQLIVAANALAVAEAMSLGRALGVDIGRLPEALAGGFADSLPLQIFGPRMAVADPGPALVTVAILRKDAAAIADAATTAGLDLTLLPTARALLDRAVADGLGAEDWSRLIRLYRG